MFQYAGYTSFVIPQSYILSRTCGEDDDKLGDYRLLVQNLVSLKEIQWTTTRVQHDLNAGTLHNNPRGTSQGR